MKLLSHCIEVIVLCVGALVLAPSGADASLIVGVDNPLEIFSGQYTLTALYSLDANTGQTAVINSLFLHSGYYAVASSPVAGTFLAFSPVNLYRTGIDGTGKFQYANVWTRVSVGDHAYDPTNGRVFALGRDWSLGVPGPPALYRLIESGVSFWGVPGEVVSYGSVGELNVPAIRLIEYIDGLGLYGTDGLSGYLIDEMTGQAVLLAPFSGQVSNFTGLAYDPDSGRLIASTGYESNPCAGLPPGLPFCPPGKISAIDPQTGVVTLLNDRAPNLYGIAAVRSPEPNALWLVVPGVAACVLLRRRRTHAVTLN